MHHIQIPALASGHHDTRTYVRCLAPVSPLHLASTFAQWTIFSSTSLESATCSGRTRGRRRRFAPCSLIAPTDHTLLTPRS